MDIIASSTPLVLELETASLAFSPQTTPVGAGISVKLSNKADNGGLNYRSATELGLRAV